MALAPHASDTDNGDTEGSFPTGFKVMHKESTLLGAISTQCPKKYFSEIASYYQY